MYECLFYKRAEATLKEKLNKTLEVHQLSININQLKSDIVGTNESLRECKSYMRFLNDIAREIMRKDEEEENRAKRVKLINSLIYILVNMYS